MTYQHDNYISSELSDADLAEVQKSLATLQAKLNFLISLTTEDRQRTAKPGSDALGASEAMVNLIEKHAELFPSNAIDPKEMRKDLALIKKLMPIQQAFDALANALNDTLLAAKSDVWRNALKGYAMAQVMARNIPGLDGELAPIKSVLDRKTHKKQPE